MAVEIKARVGDAGYQSRCKVDVAGPELVDNAWLKVMAGLSDVYDQETGRVNWGLSG